MNLINFPSEGTRFNLIAASCAGEGKTHSHGKSALALCEPTGRRQARQFGKLYLLADGVGDHAAADVASRIAVETIPAVYYHRPGGYSEGLVASPGDVGSVAARLRDELSGVGQVESHLTGKGYAPEISKLPRPGEYHSRYMPDS